MNLTDEALRAFSKEHLSYEINMLRETYRCLRVKSKPELEWVYEMALLESFTLHVRVLTLFLFRQRNKVDDVIAEDYMSSPELWKGKRGDEPRILAGAVTRIGKEFAHLTSSRKMALGEKEWNPYEIVNEVNKALQQFTQQAVETRLDNGCRQTITKLNDALIEKKSTSPYCLSTRADGVTHPPNPEHFDTIHIIGSMQKKGGGE